MNFLSLSPARSSSISRLVLPFSHCLLLVRAPLEPSYRVNQRPVDHRESLARSVLNETHRDMVGEVDKADDHLRMSSFRYSFNSGHIKK